MVEIVANRENPVFIGPVCVGKSSVSTVVAELLGLARVAFAVERVVDDHPAALLDLGAGHTCFLDEGLHEIVGRALAAYRNVVLLLPDPDPARSVEVIRRRLAADSDRDDTTWSYAEVDFVRFWVESDQNRQLADHVVYTGEDGPDDVARRVIDILG